MLGWWAEISGVGTGEPGLVAVDAWGWLDLSLSLHMALYMCSWREEEEHSISIALFWKLHFCILMVKVCPRPAEIQRGGLTSTL